MHRVSFIFAAAVFISAALPLSAAASDTFIATVSAISPCVDQSGALVTFQSTSTAPTIYKNSLSWSYPSDVVPKVGQNIFGVLGTTTTCALSGSAKPISARLLSFFEPAAFTFSGNGSGNGSNQGNGSNTGSSLLSGLSNILSSLLSAAKQGLTGASGSSGTGSFGSGLTGKIAQSAASASAGGVGVFGGFITPATVCDGGVIWYNLVGTPYAGPLMWVPGVSSVPPYLYAMGTPPVAGYIIGHYATPVPCVVGDVTVMVGPVIYGYGTGLGAGAGSGSSGSPGSPSQGKYCQSSQNDQYTQNALQQYGGNLLSGNVPGLTTYCPNYANLSTQQREGFWTKFVGGVEQAESSCQSNQIFHETGNLTGTLSEGLLQLSVGDTARGHPGACNLNSSNILNPQTNITCGVAIMDGLSSNGITNGNKGMDAYWSTLRSGRSSLANVQSIMRSFPGCN